MKKILVTGGAGYIGSHFVVKLIENGFEPVVFDDLSNSNENVFARIEEITGNQVKWYRGDIRDEDALLTAFSENNFYAVVHFAGKKSVKESQEDPLSYFSVNVEGSLCLLKLMEKFNVRNLIFSSTATVYGENGNHPIKEDTHINPINNYGKSKLMVEEILDSMSKADRRWNFCILRYFNPVGAHPSGLIGEDPLGIPANLMPIVSQVAIGRRKEVLVYGENYPTRDGTGERDYIHVEDLVLAHLAALDYLKNGIGCEVFNIGTGKSTTVKELIQAFSEVNKVTIPFKIADRRAGDSAICYADPGKAQKVLGWSSKYSLKDMCRDTWNWQRKNPFGYKG